MGVLRKALRHLVTEVLYLNKTIVSSANKKVNAQATFFGRSFSSIENNGGLKMAT